ncbi:MAG: winged helix-turn-helix domain-containing protein, partial [Candidatus Tectomicrobia bacterium]|nr:winged helix-turn-helix domain-containing protein [Candidatus Tectomicrobia bacterium]
NEHRNDVRLLRTCVCRLRDKIDKDPAKPSLIRNLVGKGYIIDKPS